MENILEKFRTVVSQHTTCNKHAENVAIDATILCLEEIYGWLRLVWQYSGNIVLNDDDFHTLEDMLNKAELEIKILKNLKAEISLNLL
jgi:hypothetical protein